MIHCIVWTSLKCSQTLSYHYSGGTQGHGLDKIMNFVNYNNVMAQNVPELILEHSICKKFPEGVPPRFGRFPKHGY